MPIDANQPVQIEYKKDEKAESENKQSFLQKHKLGLGLLTSAALIGGSAATILSNFRSDFPELEKAQDFGEQWDIFYNFFCEITKESSYFNILYNKPEVKQNIKNDEVELIKEYNKSRKKHFEKLLSLLEMYISLIQNELNNNYHKFVVVKENQIQNLFKRLKYYGIVEDENLNKFYVSTITMPELCINLSGNEDGYLILRKFVPALQDICSNLKSKIKNM